MQTIGEFDRAFGTDEQCRDFLVQMRWPDGVRCPRCDRKEKVYALKARPFHWVCKNEDCGKRQGFRFSVISGTIFENTKKPLNLWFKVGYLMLTSKKGMSALQIHRVMFGENSTHDYHTSWYICMRWRAAMAGDMYKPLSGEVEVDETYIGGKDRNRHKGKKSAEMRKAKGACKARRGHWLRQGRRDWRYPAQRQRRGARDWRQWTRLPWARSPAVLQTRKSRWSLTDENPGLQIRPRGHAA